MEWFPILIIILNYVLFVILLINLKNLKSIKKLLSKDISKDTGYNYILDRVETIFPNVFKDILLNQKKEKKF